MDGRWAWGPILPARTQPFALASVSPAMDLRAPNTTRWMLAFLVVAAAMVVSGLLLLALGPKLV